MSFEEQHVYLNFLILIFVTSWEQIYVVHSTAWKVPKYRAFSGLNTGQSVLGKIPSLDTFHAAFVLLFFVFMNIVSMFIFGQYLFNLIFSYLTIYWFLW